MKRCLLNSLLAALLPLLLVACAGPALPPLDPPEPLRPIEAGLKVEALWSAEIGEGVRGHFLRLPPLADGEAVYAASRFGDVLALDAEDGKRRWRVKLDGTIGAGPADGGDVLLLGGDAMIYALDKRDGRLRWQAAVSSEVLAAPVRAGDTVVVRCVDGGIFAIDAASGRRLWQQRHRVPQLTLRGTGAPLVIEQYIFLGYSNGEVAALSLSDGQEMWRSVVTEPRGRTETERMVDVDARLAAGGQLLFAGAYQGDVAALALANGRLIWSRDISSYTGIAIGATSIFVTDAVGDVWSLSPRNGGTLWKQTALHGRKLSEPVRQGDYILVGDFEGYLHWLRMEDGRLIGRARVGEVKDPAAAMGSDAYQPFIQTRFKEYRDLLAAPVVNGKRVYAVNKYGTLVAFEVSLLEQQ